jgi:response regulator RpfG family c-di-GMP phosphodiesterase
VPSSPAPEVRVQRNFLIVSEDAAAREGLARKLRRSGYSVTLAGNSSEALRVVRTVAVDAVVVEVRRTDAATKSLRRRILRARPNCSVIVLTSFGSVRTSNDLLQFGKDDYLVGIDEVVGLLRAPYESGGDGSSRSSADKAVKSLIETLDVLVGLVELGDRYFAGAGHQSLRLARAIAEELGLDEDTVNEVMIATLLRDIGKVDVDRDLLDENGAYDDDQRDRMRGHVIGGLRLLEHIDFPWKIAPVIRHHHERYDGTGYPDGLRGREIPLGARILGVVDSFVAMVSDRPHRQAVTPDEALHDLELRAGAELDPEVVEILIRVVEKRLPAAATGGPGRVFLANPDEEYRSLLKMKFLNEGFRVHEAPSIDEAREQFLAEPPDVLVADVGAGAGEALHKLHEIREEGALGHVPLVLVSANEDPVLKLRALRQGVDEFFARSDDLEELVVRVQNIVAREALRRSDRKARRRRGLTGHLENLSLPDIVQILVMGMKTACVRISSGSGGGEIWFRDGALVHAGTGELRGERAVFEMLRWTTGEFSIEHGVQTPSRTIENDAMFLVMEGLRLVDEDAARGPGAAAS